MTVARVHAQGLTMRANFAWTFAGNAVNALCQWGMLAVLVHLASPAVVGQFVLGLAITAPIMAIAMLQLRNLLVTDAAGDYQFADYFGARLAWTALGLGAVGLCVLIAGLEPSTAVVVLLVGVAKCADSTSDIVRGLFQRLERMDYSGRSLMLRGPAALAAMGLTIWCTSSLPWAVGAMAGTWTGTLVLHDLVVAQKLLKERATDTVGTRLRPRWHARTLARLSWLALPLGVVMGIASLQTNLPRYFLQGYVGEEALGYFGALAYPMVAATMIGSAMGQSASPRLARYFLSDLGAYRRLLFQMVLLAIGTGSAFVGGAWMFGEPILTLLYDAGYAKYQPEFVLLAVATAIQLVATCAGYGLTAARYIRVQVVLVGLSCLVTAGAAMLLVPAGGVHGAALTAIATSTGMLVFFATAIAWAVHRRTTNDVTLP